MEKELVQLIRQEIGAVAAFKKAIVVGRLPKTRSGKILRKTIRRLAVEEQIVTPPHHRRFRRSSPRSAAPCGSTGWVSTPICTLDNDEDAEGI